MNAILPILALTFAANSASSAALRAPQPVAAKGDIKGGPPLVHEFELVHSAAAGTVTITGVEASCGCLRQSLTATVLQPGQSSKLTVEVNTLTQPDGPNRWPVRVRFRHDKPGAAPETGEASVTITATVSREVTLHPPQLALSTAGEVSQELKLTDKRPKPLTVLRAESSNPHLMTVVGLRNGAETIVTLKLAATAPAGIRDETVVLSSDDPAYPEFRVPVRVEKRAAGAATAVPAEVVLRFASKDAEASSLVQVRSSDGKPVALEKAECDHPAVKLKWSPGRGPVATMRVTVGAGQTGSADVRVRLAEPVGQLLIVPISWTAK